MTPPKLVEVIRLMKLLDELYCMYRKDSGLGFTFIDNRLSTGVEYRISINSSIAYITMYGTEFERFNEFLYFESRSLQSITPEIWDDEIAIFPTQWPYEILSQGIRRVSTGRLDMMARTYPLLPSDTSLESDIIDPIIFQNLTRYTMNEVLTQLIALQVFPHSLTEYERDEKGFFCKMQIDYRVMDILSENEILELIEIIENDIQEITVHDDTDNV